MESYNFVGVVEKATSIVPGVSAIVSFVDFIFSLFGTSESQDLLELKRLFNEVDARFDSIEAHLRDIHRVIQSSQLKSQFGQIEQNINTNSGLLRNIYIHSLAVKNAEKDYFMESFKSTCLTCALNLYHGMMGTDCALTGDLFQIAMKSFSYDRKKTQMFMIGILQLLIRGVSTELVYRKLKYGDAVYSIHKSEWAVRIQNVTSRMKLIDEIVKNKYHDKASIDIDRLAAEQHTLSNQAFSTYLYNFLKNKYYWRDWLVIVYKPITGSGSHMNQVCDGYLKYRNHGRNIVIATVDPAKTHLDKSEASRIIQRLPISSIDRRRSWVCKRDDFRRCVIFIRYNANEVFNGFPDNVRSHCSPYAPAGVIDPSADIWYQAPSERLLHKQTSGIQPYSTYLFG